eukprot:TRINITY_DN69311_c0_g1_i1.p1 TRINITY_DN69311_c0_g1~~TRINITY_DN69311_c0_g1_i1.p1  ORF type:complete len:441 (-),score=80.47 TRINITY_DN69311_c0_g1_i1:176-1498(-)
MAFLRRALLFSGLTEALAASGFCSWKEERLDESGNSSVSQKEAANTNGLVLLAKPKKHHILSKISSSEDSSNSSEQWPLIDNCCSGGKELLKCQGSCSDDSDCKGALVCLEPTFQGYVGRIPGCKTTANARPLYGWKYCADAPPEGWEKTTTSTTTTTATVAPAPAPSVLYDDCPAGQVCSRLMAFNVYYAALGRKDRKEGIAKAIADMTPDIAVITEEWNEKRDILDLVRQKSNRAYEYCTGGPQEKWWDGDILYRSDLYDAVEDGVMDWGANRGLSWAVLRHKASGKQILVYGAHPVCCGNEHIHLQNAVDFSKHAKEMVAKYPSTPIVIMGDFNAHENWLSTRLYKGEMVSQGKGKKQYRLDFVFRDAFRDTNSQYVNANTHKPSRSRLDYIFIEQGAQRRASPSIVQGFRTIRSWIWRSPSGGSDHWPILADLELL